MQTIAKITKNALYFIALYVHRDISFRLRLRIYLLKMPQIQKFILLFFIYIRRTCNWYIDVDNLRIVSNLIVEPFIRFTQGNHVFCSVVNMILK